MTLVASWIPIIRNNYDNNLHIIAYSLYTNWAAIDTIRLYYRYQHDEADGTARDGALAQSIAAGQAVVFLGFTHACIQHDVYFFQQLCLPPQARRKPRISMLIVFLGLLLPLSALSYTFFSIEQASLIFLPVVLLSRFCLFAWTPARPTHTHFPPFPYRFGLAIQVPLCFVGTLPFHVRFLHRLSPSKSTAERWEIFFDRCTYAPCAPQSLKEGDQAFALFFALFFFVYEFDWDFIRLSRGIGMFLYGLYLRIIRIFHTRPSSSPQGILAGP